VQGGAIRINDAPVSDERLVLIREMLNADGVIKLSMGKKKHVLLKPA
jgi:tyrosyl-tRNA synthetase